MSAFGSRAGGCSHAAPSGPALLLATTEESRRWPLNTAAQCAVAGGIAVGLGRRGTRKAIADASEHDADDLGSGEPTPLWMHPLIVAGLALGFRGLSELDAPGADLAGWDASLRITVGSALVGLTQAVVLERQVAAAERANGRTYYRYKGSQGMRTVLAALRRG